MLGRVKALRLWCATEAGRAVKRSALRRTVQSEFAVMLWNHPALKSFFQRWLRYVLFLFMLQRCWICRSNLIHTASSDESLGSSHVLVSVAAVISDPTFSFWWFSWHCSVSGCHGVQYVRPFDHGINHKNWIYFITWSVTDKFSLTWRNCDRKIITVQ